jgi:hypothetical protein
MKPKDFRDDINREAKERRRRWGHIANYPAVLVEQLIKNDALTVQERIEVIQLYRSARDGSKQ